MTGCGCRLCVALGDAEPPPRPKTVEGYDELDLALKELHAQEPEDWWHVVRWYIAHDLFYNITRVSTLRGLRNPVSGVPLFERPFTLSLCRELEANPCRLLAAARGMGKTSLRNIQNVQRILRWPDVAIALFSYQRSQALKRAASIRAELENKILVAMFPEVLYENPGDKENGAAAWSLNPGYSVKRETSRPEFTVEAHALKIHTLPTGNHYNVIDGDDVEDDKVVRSPEKVGDLRYAYSQAQHLWSTPIERLLTGTPYHQNGLIAEKMKAPEALKFPGEDLSRPGEGPLGGTPVYFTLEELWAVYREIGNDDSYAMQVCLSTSRGAGRRLSRKQWSIYGDDPIEFGRRCWVYICIDPSLGIKDRAGDPSAFWVWGATQDRRFAWLDGSLKRLAPGERLEETWRLIAMWDRLSLGVRHVRIEEAAQSTYAEQTREFLRRRGIGTPVHGLRVGGGKTATERLWEAWHPLAQEDRLLAPRHIPYTDEKGNPGNLVDYFFGFEWEEFPRPQSDHLLSAGALIAFPPEKLPRSAGVSFPSRGDIEMMAATRDEDVDLPGGSYMSAGTL